MLALCIPAQRSLGKEKGIVALTHQRHLAQVIDEGVITRKEELLGQQSAAVAIKPNAGRVTKSPALERGVAEPIDALVLHTYLHPATAGQHRVGGIAFRLLGSLQGAHRSGLGSVARRAVRHRAQFETLHAPPASVFPHVGRKGHVDHGLAPHQAVRQRHGGLTFALGVGLLPQQACLALADGLQFGIFGDHRVSFSGQGVTRMELRFVHGQRTAGEGEVLLRQRDKVLRQPSVQVAPSRDA